MNIRFLIYALLVNFAFVAVAAGQVHNINLTPGKKMTFTGTVTAGEGSEQLYIFQAAAGQKLTVNLTSTTARFSVNEQYRVDHSPIEVDGTPVDGKPIFWFGALPASESNGLYSVSVTSTKAARSTLEITLGGSNAEGGLGAAAGAPNADVTRNVKDYYLLMPKKYDGSTRAEREEGLESETFVDLKNGYIGSEIGTLGERCQVALFKKPDGGYILAYNEDGDPTVNLATKFFLLSYEDGKWTDVTTALMPCPVNKAVHYDLPQIGKTIKVTTAKGAKLYSLVWRDGKFVKI